MEKNENKFMSKAKSFLALVLFTVIYFFFQGGQLDSARR